MNNVIEMNIDDLIPYENNPRINDESVTSVAKSIKEFGWQQPIVVDKDKVIIVGHTRLRAAKQLGLKKVPVVIADDLTDNQAKAYRIADNKTAEISSWDYEKLNKEIDELISDQDDIFNLADLKIEDDGISIDDLGSVVSDEDQKQVKRYIKVYVIDESKRNFIFKEICKVALKLELEVS